MKEAYAQGIECEDDEDSVGDRIKPRDVGHNIYILAHQVRTMPVALQPLLFVSPHRDRTRA